jgi:hypothetical protein
VIDEVKMLPCRLPETAEWDSRGTEDGSQEGERESESERRGTTRGVRVYEPIYMREGQLE